MGIFFIIVIAILASVYLYIGIRLINPLPLGIVGKLFLWVILISFFALPLFSMVARRYDRAFWDEPFVSWATWLSMGIISLLFVLLAFRDMILLDFRLFRLVSSRFHKRASRASRPSLFNHPGFPRPGVNQVNLAILGITAILTVWGVYGARRVPPVVQREISIDGLPGGFEGFRIVQITDLHVGPTIRRGFVEKIVERVAELKPDMILFTGDLADGYVEELRNDVGPLVQLSAPHGKFFITGNHEYYYDLPGWIAEARRLGFDVLLNEHRVIRLGEDAILLAGVTDYSGGHFSPEHTSSAARAVSGAPPLETKILLAHQPRSIHEAAKLGFDFQISGHTHGGQYFPWSPFVYLQQPFVAGLHRYGDTLVYTSRGAGYWGPPLRIDAPSEITLFILVGD